MNTNKLIKALDFSKNISKNNKFIKCPKVLFWLGKIQIYSGEFEEGKKNVQLAIYYDPDMKDCVLFLKILKEQQILKEEAQNHFLKKNYKESI